MSAGTGAHTGDALHSGYALGRNSSKVLAPPGGACSDIFGTGAGGWNQEKRAQSATERVRNESSVFRSPIRNPASEIKTAAAERRGHSSVFSNSPQQQQQLEQNAHKEAAARQAQSSIFESEPQRQQAPAQQQQAPQSPARRQAPGDTHGQYKAPQVHASVGAHTGDALMSGYSLGRNSSRVLQPPGGRCSNIFG